MSLVYFFIKIYFLVYSYLELDESIKCYETYLMNMDVQVSLTQARIDMSELDEDSDGFLQPHVWVLISVGPLIV